MKSIVFLIFSALSLNAQYYGIDKDKSRELIEQNDTLNSADKFFLSSSIEMNKSVFFLNKDTVYFASGGFYPRMDTFSKAEFIEQTYFKNNVFNLGHISFHISNQESDSLMFSQINDQVAKRLQNETEQAFITDSLIIFESLTQNFDTINAGQVLVHTFNFTNKSDESLIIYNVKSDCGCTVPEWPKRAIKPGSHDSIIVSYDTTNKPSGKSTRMIKVKHNLYNQPIKLKLSAFIKNPDKQEVDILRSMDKPFLGDTITHVELLEKQEEYDNLLSDFNKIEAFFGSSEEISFPDFEEINEIDTLSNNQYVIRVNWQKFLELTQKLKKKGAK
ncbi:MAG: DUF1573 domain-containing protein [Bacteroidia bacterium]|nr:DUF1573 domain-containing protein [Bacteroidia bacterium]